MFKLKSPDIIERAKAKLKQRYIRHCEFASAVGNISAVRLALWNRRHDLWVRPKGTRAPVLIRGESSDLDVFLQIFAEKEYSCLVGIDNVDLMIDAGANVGYSSIYLLSRYPNSRVLAVEPDPANFRALQKNLAPYADRAQVQQCGVWSKACQLSLQTQPYRDGRDWSRQVRESDISESGEIRAVTVDDILRDSGHGRLSLLKMDIEGAEAVVFADSSCQAWLEKTDAIVIELHDDTVFGPASELFHAAIRDHHFQISHRGELTVCRRVAAGST